MWASIGNSNLFNKRKKSIHLLLFSCSRSILRMELITSFFIVSKKKHPKREETRSGKKGYRKRLLRAEFVAVGLRGLAHWRLGGRDLMTPENRKRGWAAEARANVDAPQTPRRQIPLRGHLARLLFEVLQVELPLDAIGHDSCACLRDSPQRRSNFKYGTFEEMSHLIGPYLIKSCSRSLVPYVSFEESRLFKKLMKEIGSSIMM